LERFRRTRDLTLLWPDVPERRIQIAHGAIARATTALLTGDERAPSTPLQAHGDVRALGIAGLLSGMGPLLGYWIEQRRLTADRDAAELLALHLEHGRRRNRRLMRELDRILGAFDERGVTVVLLKGADTAQRYFPDPGTRPMTDLDLLISPESVTAARSALQALGFVERNLTQLPLRSEWTPPGATGELQSLELNHSDNPWVVDLHVTLDRGPYPPVTLGPIDVAAQPVWGGNPRTRMLGQPLHLTFLACHTAHELPLRQLHRLVELALVMRRDFAGRPDAWDALAAFAAATQTAPYVYASVELVERLVPGSVDRALRARLRERTPRRVQRFVASASLDPPLRLPPVGVGARLMWATRPRDYVAYVAHLVWPQTPAGPVGIRDFLRLQARRVSRLGAVAWRRVSRLMASPML
jgi:hypothetical protein